MSYKEICWISCIYEGCSHCHLDITCCYLS